VFTAICTPHGGEPVELTPFADSVSFSTMAYGGFGSCSFKVPLSQAWNARLPHLSDVRLLHGSKTLWEGRIEDRGTDFIRETVSFTNFGYQRLLDDTSVKRVWVQRTIPWQLCNNLNGIGWPFKPEIWAWTTVGRFDDTDLTRNGLRFSAQTNEFGGAYWGHGAWYWTDAQIQSMYFRGVRASSDPGGIAVYDSETGANWSAVMGMSVPDYMPGTQYHVNFNTFSGAGPQFVRLVVGLAIQLNGTNAATEIDDIRILGTTTSEQVTGGFYPSYIIQDLLALVPELKVGTIDDDTTFFIDNLSRAQRDKVISVLQEVSSFYSRVWGVWEDKRFDWRRPNYDEPQWVLHVPDLTACEITSSCDNVAKTFYLEYQNAATGLPNEASTVVTNARNPFVRAGRNRDEVLSAPVGMTARSSAALIARVASDHGALPAVRGKIALPAFTLAENLVGQAKPACYIRAGENIVIPELPKDEYLLPGRDGQTLFHVTATETNMEEQRTTLELEGYTRTSDILMARMAAATRTLTG
jgi:hypothetical protein